METKTAYPFTIAQFKALSDQQRASICAVAGYLSDYDLEADDCDDETISSALNLLKVCKGCVPEEEIGEELLYTIRKKFSAIYYVASELAERELVQKGLRLFEHFSFCTVIDACFEDATHLAIVDYKTPVSYLHEYSKAWHMGFQTLAEIADEVLRVKDILVTKVASVSKPREIFVVMQEGKVREIVDLPDNLNVTVINYDVEDLGPEHLQISPIDGEACVMEKF